MLSVNAFPDVSGNNSNNVKVGIVLAGQQLLKNPKTHYKIFFKDKHGAVVGTFCPSRTKTQDMLDDFIEIASNANWVLPIFEVFNNEKKTPKNSKEYMKLPNMQ